MMARLLRGWVACAAAALCWVLAAAFVAGAGGCSSAGAYERPTRLAPASIQLASDSVQVPMRPSPWGVPILFATVGSAEGPGAQQGMGSAGGAVMYLDTGASFVIVSPELVSRAGLALRSANLFGSDAAGKVRKSDGVARVGRLCLVGPPSAGGSTSPSGDAGSAAPLGPFGGSGAVAGAAGASANVVCFGAFDAYVTDMNHGARVPGVRVDGHLGLPLFRDVLLTIDYPRARLRVERGDLPPPDSQEVLPIQIAAGGRVLVPLRLGGREVWANLDTGFSGGLVIPDWAVAAFPGAEKSVEGGDKFSFVHGGSGRARVARLTEDLRVGRHVIRRPVVSVGLGQDPTIGTEYLSNFAITIDQRNRRIRFARPSGSAPITVPPVYRAGFEADPATGLVKYVLPNSGAQRAGLRVGDKITSLEGVPFNRYLRDGGPEKLKIENHVGLEIERANRRLRLNVPLTVVVP